MERTAAVEGRRMPNTQLRCEVEEFLDAQEPNYNNELSLLGRRWVSPGYHSSVPTGAWVHATRESLSYAACLTWRGRPADLARARQVIHAVVSLQERRTTEATYGIWPWMYEQPLAAMDPPDWNWADFCGNALLTIHRVGGELLGRQTLEEIREAVEAAALAIFRRNVDPGYTNIAVMGGVMTAAAGELLGEDWCVEYGRERLKRVLEHIRVHGDFTEYNSPTYTMVALEEAERALYLVTDPEVRDAAERLRWQAWTVIADHFHPATDQWAGPHSRAYSDYLKPNVARRIGRSVARELRIAEQIAEERSILDDVPSIVPELPCPDELRCQFDARHSAGREVRRRFFLHHDGRERTGYTWIDPEVSLGSISDDSMWTQRRGVIGYWRGGPTRPAVFRIRGLKDGRDFASLQVLAAQRERTVLAAVTPACGYGDYHLSLDRSTTGCYDASSLVVRLSVAGDGARVTGPDSGTWLLSCGEWGVSVRIIDACFGAGTIRWSSGCDNEHGRGRCPVACLDAELTGAGRFCPQELHDARVVVLAQVIRAADAADSATACDDLVSTATESHINYACAGLSLAVPRFPSTRVSR